MDDIDLSVPEEHVLDACGEQSLPEMGVIEQQWETSPLSVSDIERECRHAVRSLQWDGVPEGGEVAIGVGSRGIANLSRIVESVVQAVDELGYEPFVFPSMGSHGGATAEGQREMLATLDVTPERIGCEIRSSMATEQIGTTEDRDVPVVADANAVSADAILPINRIKPHTDFDGTVESGLSKMLVIGMGKQRGAKIAHEWAVDWSFRNMIPEMTEQLIAELPIVGGVAVVEDQLDDTAIVEGIRPDEFLDRERELLERAYDLMPKLPFDELDVLIVDAAGKNISGQGMDTNVIGRRPFSINEPEPELPEIKRIFLRSLTPASHGNAMGMGSADVVHEDVVRDLDASTTLINAITASTIRGVKLPPVVATDRAGLTIALSTIGVVDPETVRVLRVSDTMHLRRVDASPALLREARDREDLAVVREPSPLSFDEGAFTDSTPRDR